MHGVTKVSEQIQGDPFSLSILSVLNSSDLLTSVMVYHTDKLDFSCHFSV